VNADDRKWGAVGGGVARGGGVGRGRFVDGEGGEVGEEGGGEGGEERGCGAVATSSGSAPASARARESGLMRPHPGPPALAKTGAPR